MGWQGHFWTLAGTLQGRAPAWTSWSTSVPDELHGAVRLTGRLSLVPGARSIVVAVHGLGGHPDTRYQRRAAAAAVAAGASCLRLGLRGADRSGEDFYHAGLTADLEAALASPEVARHERVHLLGYSLGGHVVLRLAALAPPPELRSAAAVCPPLDLAATARLVDEEVAPLYRAHVLRSLKSIYARVAARRPVPTPLERVRRAKGLRELDLLTVVPRHGFDGLAHYYESQSVAPLLRSLTVPALIVAAEHDPLVSEGVVRPALPAAAPGLEVRWVERGGHVGFPAGLRLGERAPAGLEPQVVAWLLRA